VLQRHRAAAQHGSDRERAARLDIAIGPAGSIAAAAAAVVLTVGAANAYVNGALAMVRQLIRPGSRGRRASAFLLAIGVWSLVFISLYGFRLVSTAALVTLPTTLFLTVYLGSMLAATRVLRGAGRVAAYVASLAVLAMLPYCGWALIAPAAVAVVIGRRSRRDADLPALAASTATPEFAGDQDGSCVRPAMGIAGTASRVSTAAATVHALATAAKPAKRAA
jgi:amino acid efflux transporter